MEVPVIIEPVNGNGYRVTGAGGLSVGLSAEGATAKEAIDRLAEQIQSRLHAGAKLAELIVATDSAPPPAMDTPIRNRKPTRQARSGEKPVAPDELNRRLLASGLVIQLPDPAEDAGDADDFPIEIRGEPLSETIIRERR